MSSSIALRRSPKPGAFTAATLRPPRSFVDDQGGKRLAFDILCDDQQRPPALYDGFENRQQRLQAGEFLLV
jgi:hypothetical protein